MSPNRLFVARRSAGGPEEQEEQSTLWVQRDVPRKVGIIVGSEQGCPLCDNYLDQTRRAALAIVERVPDFRAAEAAATRR